MRIYKEKRKRKEENKSNLSIEFYFGLGDRQRIEIATYDKPCIKESFTEVGVVQMANTKTLQLCVENFLVLGQISELSYEALESQRSR